MKSCDECEKKEAVYRDGDHYYCEICAVKGGAVKDSFYGRHFAANPRNTYAVSALIQVLILLSPCVLMIATLYTPIFLFISQIAAVIAALIIPLIISPKILIKFKIINFLFSPATIIFSLTMTICYPYMENGVFQFPKQA
jgi:hypothetical protein